MTELTGFTPAPSLWRAETRATATLALPLVVTNLAQMAITTTDVVFLGWLGPHALAAGTLGATLFHGFILPAFGLAIAVSPLVAEARGRGRGSVRDVRRSVRQGVWSCAAMTVPISLLLWNAEPLLRLVGQAPDLARDAAWYLKFQMWSVLPSLLFMTLRNVMSAFERPTPALAATAVAIGVNAVVGYGLVFGAFGLPALGLAGAGIAGSLSSLVMVLTLAAIVLRDRRLRRYRLLGNFWRPDWERFRTIWRLGLPIGVTTGFEIFAFETAVFMVGAINATQLAAHAIAVQLAALTFMIPLGIGQAATVRVALAVGRGERSAATRAGWVAIGLGVGVMALAALAFTLAPTQLIGLFIDIRAPGAVDVARYAASFLAIAAIFQIVDGAQVVTVGALRGLQDTRVPMLLAGLGYWALGLPVGALLAYGFGLEGRGVWIGLAVGLAAAATLLLARWTRLSHAR